MRPSRAGGAVPFAPSTPSYGVPVLSILEDLTFQWAYTGPNPPAFFIEQSVNGETLWTDFDTVGGDARSDAGAIQNFFYRVTATDDDHIPLAASSNVVFLPPAPDAPLITGNSTSDFYFDWNGADPDHWQSQLSDNQTGPWTDDNQNYGDQRSVPFSTNGNWYRVAGMNSDGDPVTDWSPPFYIS